MTQRFVGVAQALGYDHPALLDVQQTTALVHWRTLLAATAAGGRALFFTDIVSNETYPLDELPRATDLAPLCEELLRRGNCFRGGDLGMHARALRADAALRAGFDRPRARAPWLWRAGPERVFLVSGWTLDRREGWRP